MLWVVGDANGDEGRTSTGHTQHGGNKQTRGRTKGRRSCSWSPPPDNSPPDSSTATATSTSNPIQISPLGFQPRRRTKKAVGSAMLKQDPRAEVVGGRGRYHGRHNVGRGVATHICGASSSILCICQVTSAPSTVRPWKSAFSSSIPAAADDVLWAEPRETHFIGTCSCSCRAVRRRVVRRW